MKAAESKIIKIRITPDVDKLVAMCIPLEEAERLAGNITEIREFSEEIGITTRYPFAEWGIHGWQLGGDCYELVDDIA